MQSAAKEKVLTLRPAAHCLNIGHLLNLPRCEMITEFALGIKMRVARMEETGERRATAAGGSTRCR